MRVLFNASVVLAGTKSRSGASGVLLRLVKNGVFTGVITEVIFDEIIKHAQKLGFTVDEMREKVIDNFSTHIESAPAETEVKKFTSKVLDANDAHVLASYRQYNCGALVTLDKKHLLALKGKIKGIQIFSPGDMIKFFSVETKRKSN